MTRQTWLQPIEINVGLAILAGSCLLSAAAGASELGALTTEELLETYVQDSIALSRENQARQQEGIEAAEEEFIRRVSLPGQATGEGPDQALSVPDSAMFRPGLAEVPGVPFSLSDDLPAGLEQSLNFDGQTLNFSFSGDLPGFDMDRLGEGFQGGPVELTPRPGGGFDFSIQVPE